MELDGVLDYDLGWVCVRVWFLFKIMSCMGYHSK